MVVCLALLCLLDMWTVNRRYLNNGNFIRPTAAEQAFPLTDVDAQILQDGDKYYRVLNLSVNTFNDNTTSYYHKSIGGYHAAKLRRYQELIEAHIQGEISQLWQSASTLDQANGDSLFPVLNMLNMKHVILPLQGGGKAQFESPFANGNAWFVREVRYVDDADAELAGLQGLDTKHVAVADKKWAPLLSPEGDAGFSPRGGWEGAATLTSYEANELHYDVESRDGGVLVFSEIYYPGWTCTVDGQDVPIGRVNYVLRAIRIDGGRHQVVLTFKPRSERITEGIAYSALGLLALLFVGLVARSFLRRRKA